LPYSGWVTIKHELLRVLDKPYLPLHNNLSERDIRDYVKKRKNKRPVHVVRQGESVRDTFASLKRPAKAQNFLLGNYLKDRLMGTNNIQPPYLDLISGCGLPVGNEKLPKTTLKSYWLTILPTIVNIILSNVAGVFLKTIGSATLLDTTEITLEWAKNHDLERN